MQHAYNEGTQQAKWALFKFRGIQLYSGSGVCIECSCSQDKIETTHWHMIATSSYTVVVTDIQSTPVIGYFQWYLWILRKVKMAIDYDEVLSYIGELGMMLFNLKKI